MRGKQKKTWWDMISTFLCVCALFVGFRYFVRFPVVNGESMEPTYQSSDRLVVLYTKDLSVNDTVVVWSESLNEYIVKRVIGMPGDTLVLKNGVLSRNGVRLLEFYIKEKTWKTVDVTVTLAEDQYFLLGDNRNHSTDSRVLGTVYKDDVFGKVLFRLQKGEN